MCSCGPAAERAILGMSQATRDALGIRVRADDPPTAYDDLCATLRLSAALQRAARCCRAPDEVTGAVRGRIVALCKEAVVERRVPKRIRAPGGV